MKNLLKSCTPRVGGLGEHQDLVVDKVSLVLVAAVSVARAWAWRRGIGLGLVKILIQFEELVVVVQA